MIGLITRILSYSIFGGLGLQGAGEFDISTGVYSIDITSVENLIVGGVGVAATFVISRFAKVK